MRNNSTWAPSALSPIRWPEGAWNPLAAAGAAIATLLISLAVGLAYLIAYAAYARAAGATLAGPARFPAIQLLLAQVVSYVPLVIFLLVVLPPLARVSLAELGIRTPTPRDIGIGAIGTVAMWLAVVLSGSAIAAITHRHDTESAVALLKDLKGPWQLAIFVAVACVFAPIAEELTFRTLIFNAVTKYASIAVAAVVSALLFGAEHVIGTPIAELLTVALPLACGGVVLAYVYATSRNFWSSVTTHACFNTINVVALIFFHVT